MYTISVSLAGGTDQEGEICGLNSLCLILWGLEACWRLYAVNANRDRGFYLDWLLHVSISRVWCLLLAFTWDKRPTWEDDKEAWVTPLDKLRLQALLFFVNHNIVTGMFHLKLSVKSKVIWKIYQLYPECQHFYFNPQAHILAFIFNGKYIRVIFNSKLWFVSCNCS